jgi:hypothetical protein
MMIRLACTSKDPKLVPSFRGLIASHPTEAGAQKMSMLE